MLDTTLIPAIVRVRASRKGLFAGQATFGRCVSKTEWVYGFKVALSVTPEGIIAAFGLAEANSDERPIGEFLLTSDGHDAFLADKGFSSVAWEKHWLEEHGALVAATPQKSARRAWPEAVCRWAAGKRQFIEGVIWQLLAVKGLFRAGATPREELGRVVDPAGRQGGRLHRRASAKRAARSPATWLRRALDLIHSTTAV